MLFDCVFLPFCFITNKCDIRMTGFTHVDGDDVDFWTQSMWTQPYATECVCAHASLFGFVDCTHSNADIDRLVASFIEFSKTISRCGSFNEHASEVYSVHYM